MDGSCLMYKKNVNDQLTLVIVGADGKGRSLQPLPDGAVVNRLADAASPDGKWLAFYTGSAEGSPFDLALNLMDLSNGQTRLLAPLLSADHPDTFRQAADVLAQRGITLVEGVEPSVVPQFLRDAFVRGIGSLAWSPDGRYLAFAGQMDGLFSDVYVYDVETQAIERLSDGEEQVQSITWSPDGRWILHGSTNLVRAGSEIHYHAAAVDGSATNTLPDGDLSGIQGWLGPSTYLQSDGGTHNLRSVDIETGAVEILWESPFHAYAIDPVNDLLAVIGSEHALSLIYISDGSRCKIQDAVWDIKFIGVGDKRFMATFENKTFFVMTEGSWTEAGFGTNRAEASPDLRYVVVLGETLQVYTWGDNLVRDIELVQPASAIDQIIWRPDSPGLFFTFGSDMYAVDLLDGEIYQVDEGVSGQLDYTFSTPADMGPEAAWDAPGDFYTAFDDCWRDTSATPPECLVSAMQDWGASPQAIELAGLLGGDGFAESCEEYGVVDVAKVFHLPRPYVVYQHVLVNGTPRVVYAWDDLGDIDITQDPRYPDLVQKYPDLGIEGTPSTGFEGMEQLPQGGQRFIFSYNLVDGCRVCRTGGHAFVAFDFDCTGQFLGTEFLHLKK